MKKIWHGSKDLVTYSAKLNGIKFEYFVDTGNKETSGGGNLLPRHFFKPKWQGFFKDVFSQKDFDNICNAIKAEYELFQKYPEKYKRKPYQPK
jgi:hypothetical protein